MWLQTSLLWPFGEFPLERVILCAVDMVEKNDLRCKRESPVPMGTVDGQNPRQTAPVGIAGIQIGLQKDFSLNSALLALDQTFCVSTVHDSQIRTHLLLMGSMYMHISHAKALTRDNMLAHNDDSNWAHS